MRTTIKISDIKIPERIRKKVDDIESLAESIKQIGLLQPIGLTDDFTLVWGFRRMSACKHLGLTEIDYINAREVPEDERDEMEYAENVERSDFTWQEKALGLLRIWRKKRLRGAAEGWKWGDRAASREFKMSVGTVQYVLRVAKRLEAELALPVEKRVYWQYQNASEAYRLGLIGEESDKLQADLARVAKSRATTVEQSLADAQVVAHVAAVESSPDALDEERARYQANKLNVVPFDEYWAERKAHAESAKNTITISPMLKHVHCIEYMYANPNTFDHIITDAPYAIDMEMLNQVNTHGGMVDIDKLEETHDVTENLDLIAKFFPAAWTVTKEKAFVIVCTDQMTWQHMYDCATTAGFAVQRWPFIWRKVNQPVMNNCAGYNTTKDFEIAMVCRKPSATLMKGRNSSILDASNVEVKRTFGHPFGKPFELTKAFLEMVSLPGQLILEPFAGGGSMVIEILRQGRRVIACEKDEHWYNMLQQNVRNYYLKINPKFEFK